MKKLIYQIKTEGNKLKEKNDEELNQKIEELKKRAEKEKLENFFKKERPNVIKKQNTILFLLYLFILRKI